MKNFKKFLSILLCISMVFVSSFSSFTSVVDENQVESTSKIEEELKKDLGDEIAAEILNEDIDESDESLKNDNDSDNDNIEDTKSVESEDENSEATDDYSSGISEEESLLITEESEETLLELTEVESENISESSKNENDIIDEDKINNSIIDETNQEIVQKSTKSEINTFGAEGDLVYWAVRQSGSKYYLYLSMTETSNITNNNNLDKGSFSNMTSFSTEDEVPWHNYRNDITNVSVNSYINCVSIAYWFKDFKTTSISNVLNKNELITDISHAFENSKIKNFSIYAHNDIKNMDSAFKNCVDLKYVQTSKLINYDATIQKLEENGFKDAFIGCSSLRRINLRFMDFSEYTGDICSFNNLSNLVKITVNDSGDLFKNINLNGEWWVYDTGNKYTSSNIPSNIQVIRKYETFNNTIYWYYKDDNNDELHISSNKPTHTNYKEGHYFNGDESNVYGLLPRDEADDCIIVLDNNIVIKNDGGSNFFSNLAYGCKEIKNIDKLNTSNVTDMTWMFGELNVTTLDLSTLDTKNVTSTNCMFYGCKNLTSINLASFDTKKVTDMGNMFYGCTSLTVLDISSFSSDNLNDGDEYNDDGIWGMFEECSSLATIYVSSSFNITYDSEYGDGTEVFTGCTSLVGGNGTQYKEEYVYAKYARIDKSGIPGLFTAKSGSDTSVTHILPRDWYDVNKANIAKSQVSKITFQVGGNVAIYTDVYDIDSNGLKCYVNNNNKEIIIYIPEGDKLKTGENCRLMFSFDEDYNSSLKSIENLSVLDTTDSTNMSDMFYGNRVLTSLDLSNFKTENVRTMQNMFEGCYKLQSIKGLNKFNTSKVTYMDHMFSNCSSLQNIDLSNFDTYYCNGLEYMFYSCSSITSLDISKFDTYNQPDIEGMFQHCVKLKTIYASDKFDISYSIDSSEMFQNCLALVGGKGTKYNPSHIDKEYAKIDKGPNSDTPGYFTDKSSQPSQDECIITIKPSKKGSGSSSGDSGSDSSGGTVGPSVQQNNVNNQNAATEVKTTKAQTTSKNDANTKQVVSTNAAWVTDPLTGGFKLNVLNEQGLPVAATNGFYSLNSVVTTMVNNIPVQVAVSDTYFFDAAGNMVTGWVQTVDNKWYFFDNTPNANMGKMTTGWREVQGSYYYFNPDGTMMTNGITPDGYTIGADGKWVR